MHVVSNRSKHGGYRQRRKEDTPELTVLCLHVKPETYQWIDSVAKALQITKGEALDMIVNQDQRRVWKKAEK